jgi:hypothetical protein
MGFILKILGVIALYVAVGVLELTSSNLKEIDAQEIARPAGALDWIVEIAGVGFAGGILGGLAGTTLAMSLVQFQPSLFGAFPIDLADWLRSYGFLVPLCWLIVGPLGSAATDLLLKVARLKRRRVFLIGGGFALAAIAAAYSILLWREFTNWM